MKDEVIASKLTLDHNEQIPLHAGIGHIVDQERELTVSIDLSSLKHPENLGKGHFQNDLKIVAVKQDGTREALPITPEYANNKLTFDGIVSADIDMFEVALGKESIMRMKVQGRTLVPDERYLNNRLFVDEIRMLANSEVLQSHLPTSRSLFEGFDPQKHAPVTELHTHSSAQLSAKDLIDIALEQNIDYPTELLTKKLGIVLTPEEEKAVTVKAAGLRFSPCEKEGLKCEKQGGKCDVIPLSALTEEHRMVLQQQLRIPQDMTLAFTDFDPAYYRFVNPIVKNPNIARPMILKIARDFAKKGVQYAELSTASMLNLDANGEASWFREAIQAIHDAEEETGVKLRFLISIPRNYTSYKAMMEFEKIKVAARHPYVVGMDLVGYEYNKTSDFGAILSHAADWARAPEGTELKPGDGWDFQKDFTFRIHGGETGKNAGNVAEPVRIAEHFGVQVRIAHALHEKPDSYLDKKIHELSSREPPLVSMEFCAPSNIAYNNIKNIQEVPFRRWLKCCKNWFIGSDGAGAIQTDPNQLALSAMAAGVSLQQLEQMRECETAYIARQQANFERKSKAFSNHYQPEAVHDEGFDPKANARFIQDLSQHIEAIQKPDISIQDPANPSTTLTVNKMDPVNPVLPEEFKGKMPILMAGASKESFDQLSRLTQTEIRNTLRMLVDALDPQKVYFVMGRTKREGITAVLDAAILDHNRVHPHNKFKVLALSTKDTPDLPHSFSWLVPQPGEIGQVPANISKFMHARYQETKQALNIFISGSNFTGDMIKKTRDTKDMPYLLMENAAGASQAASKEVRSERKFRDGMSLLMHIHDLDLPVEGGIFRKEVDPRNADLLKEWVESRRMLPKPGTQHWPVDPAAPIKGVSIQR